MAGSIHDWPRLFTQAHRSLRPGGWLEMQEFDVWFRLQTSAGEAELPPDCAIAQWQTHLDEASRLFSKRPECRERAARVRR